MPAAVQYRSRRQELRVLVVHHRRGHGHGEDGDDLGEFAHLDGFIASLNVFRWTNLDPPHPYIYEDVNTLRQDFRMLLLNDGAFEYLAGLQGAHVFGKSSMVYIDTSCLYTYLFQNSYMKIVNSTQ